MASTWIETHKFYNKLLSICRSYKLPTLSKEAQTDLFPKLVQTIGHSDFMDQMVQYIEELSYQEDDRDIYDDIRVRMGEWYAASSSCQPFLAEYLANWIQNQPVLPDTFFIQKKIIESIRFTRHSDGSIDIEIQNEGDKWSIKRTYSVKQRFLVYRFLESCTRAFDQVSANITRDLGKEYEFEPRDKFTKMFKEEDHALESELVGRSYYLLKYFVGMDGERKRFYTHRTISGNPDLLREDFLDSYAKGFVKQFVPQHYPRQVVQPVSSSCYDTLKKRHPDGTIRVHICDNIGVIESRPKGVKSSKTFPFCAVILENGELLMRNNFDEEPLLIRLLS